MFSGETGTDMLSNKGPTRASHAAVRPRFRRVSVRSSRLSALNFTDFDVERVYGTPNGRCEFTTVLKKTRVER
jgi:hypothetical protein